MKHMIYRLGIMFLAIMHSLISLAYDFQAEGFYFDIIEGTNNVFIHPNHAAYQSKYSGDITIPAKVTYSNKEYTVVGIGEYAFAASSITSITMPETIKFIDAYAFRQCAKLTKIVLPSSLESIRARAFYETNFTSIEIPNSVKELGAFAFGRSSLSNVILSNSITELSEGVFEECSNLSSIVIPSSITIIGKDAFFYCEKLTSVLLPSTLSTIKTQAFYYCTSLKSIDLPQNITTIESYAFFNCGLTSVTLPASLTSIGKSAFSQSVIEVHSKIKKPFETYAFSTWSGGDHDRILYVPYGTKELYVNCYGWGDFFKEIIEEAETYTFQITALGNGSASYGGTTIRSKTSSFTVNEGTSATISFTPDAGYRIKSVKVNGTDVTSSVSNNQYTISNISSDTTLEVEFEAIPPTTYTLSIKATGNGSASYDGTTIRSKTSSFTVNEGTSATISFIPDAGYRIKGVKMNGSDVTSSVSNNQYTISNISTNTTLEVVFEVIPPTIYTLNIVASGNGNISYESTIIRNQSKEFSITEGNDIVLLFAPDKGFRVGTVKVNNNDVTGQVAADKLTISKVTSDVNVEVTFEEIPPTTYSLAISAVGNGSATYEGTEVRNTNKEFTVVEGTYAAIFIKPDNGYRVAIVKLDNTDVTNTVTNNQLITNKIMQNTNVSIEFVEDVTDVSDAGVNYKVVSYDEQTLLVSNGDYGLSINVPATISAKGKEWSVVGVEENALNNAELAAIIWNPTVVFNGTVTNPNLLFYVKDKAYAPSNIQNVIVSGEAEEIILTDAESGNNFYCPQAFIAKKVSYEHNYSMTSGFKTCQGWETIVLPFDVTAVLNATAQELVPYKVWNPNSSQRPFWLYSLSSEGWKESEAIKANTPYIISMPNNENYDASYNQSGNIQFIGNNVQVKTSDNLYYGKTANRNLVPNFQNQANNSNIYALNVNNLWNKNTASETEGSTFVRSLRPVHPFEAYMTVEGASAAMRAIPINETPTGIFEIKDTSNSAFEVWYTLDGLQLQGKPTKKGLYIVNGRKVIVK